MAADHFVVTYLLLGGLYPREKNVECWGRVSNNTLSLFAPDGAFAFLRSDRSGATYYIGGEVFAVEELQTMGKHKLAQKAIADGARSAVRLKGTRLWAPFYTTTDQVIRTGR